MRCGPLLPLKRGNMLLQMRPFVRQFFVPLCLILLCPLMVILMWYINTDLDGSLSHTWNFFMKNGPLPSIKSIVSPVFFGSKLAWKMIAIFATTQLLFMKIFPGKIVKGPITPQGNLPLYKANGLLAFFTTLLLFYLSTALFHLFPATIIYDNLGPLLGALNFFSLLFCLFLYFKGKYKPSSTDSGSSGNFIFDYFWGTELYPRIAGWDVKMFTNCRFGMMSWGLILLSFGAKQAELYGLSNSMMLSITLQLLYITKFFHWEPGYLRSMDIMHDRAGYAICWGCLVWVPGIYTSPTLYLVNHPISLSVPLFSLLLGVGIISIAINYFADAQRQKARATGGQCLIWKKKPEIIIASYHTVQGDKKESLLLLSGWWSVARHFHYAPEMVATLCWSLPALFTSPLPYFYLVFLVALLIDRSSRHERRCALKYGKYWEAYCEKVPYKIIPYVY